MKLGVLADTHDEIARTREAVRMLCDIGADAIIHCGDLSSPLIVAECAVRPFWFTLGNHDADAVPALQLAAAECGAVCLGWGGVIELAGRRVGVVHGHMTGDARRVLGDRPDYVFSGHSHIPSDVTTGTVRRINPGALHRADEYTVAVVDLASGELRLLRVPG